MATLESDDVRTLADIGFIALSRGLVAQAGTIFNGVVAARPDQEAGYIGHALVDLARGDVGGAIKTLRALPPTDAALTFLATALARHGEHAEACDILSELIRTAPVTPFAAMARHILAELRS
jgi:hypothetical protein